MAGPADRRRPAGEHIYAGGMVAFDPTAFAARHRVRRGLLSVEESTALASVGFEPVSEVFGAVANAVLPGGFYSSGFYGSGNLYTPGFGGVPGGFTGMGYQSVRTYTSSSNNPAMGTPPTIIALRAGYQTALSRLTAEARALDADGVVDIQLSLTSAPSAGAPVWNFLASGTAVRSRGRTHAVNPFTAMMSAAQTASALRGGWVPVTAIILPCMAIRWVDPRSRGQRMMMSANGEVDAYSDVVNTCRRQARDDFERAARAARADGAVLSRMTIQLDAPSDESVCVASVTIAGTALAQLGTHTPTIAPLTILPLRKGSVL